MAMRKSLPNSSGRGFLFCVKSLFEKHERNGAFALRTAAIGIGSNSLRMLLAQIDGNRLIRLGRYREGLRVFAALDEQKRISGDMIAKACESVVSFQKEALAQGAETVHLFATSAVRDAANQQEMMQALDRATGLETDICSGDREAHLSFWGVAEQDECGMIDIGGGSTEIVVGRQRDVFAAASLQMGAVRLFRQLPIASAADAQKVVNQARQLLQPVLALYKPYHPARWLGVGGTFTASAALVQQIPWNQRQSIHGYVISQEEVAQTMERLAPMPLSQRYELPGLQPQRADIVVHGMAILLGCMQEMGISQIQVSECGNLEGYLKEKYLFQQK